MGQRAITDHDEFNHHDNEITNILEGKGASDDLSGGEGLALPKGGASLGAYERRFLLAPSVAMQWAIVQEKFHIR